MKDKQSRFHPKYSWSRVLFNWFYLPFLLLFCLVACFIAYIQVEQNFLLSKDFVFQQLEQEYNQTVENFWQLYLPIFEGPHQNYDILDHYFSSADSEDFSPLEKKDLINALQDLFSRDSKVQWVALYSPNRTTNYVLSSMNGTLDILPADFPYNAAVQAQTQQLAVYGAEAFPQNEMSYAICGGIPAGMGSGHIIVGYSLTPYKKICASNESAFQSLEFIITTKSGILFHSSGIYDEQMVSIPLFTDNSNLESHSVVAQQKTATLHYQYSKVDLFVYANQHAPVILLITLFFILFLLLANIFVDRKISKEVTFIHQGLKKIGNNELAHRFTPIFRQAGLNDIALSINEMAHQLNESTQRANQYQAKQREAELAELQSKFNPHFLYNCLETVRLRCYQNGDAETARLVAQLALIFRGLISGKTVVPLSEELTFSKRYSTLFGARYEGQVEILYEVETELLDCGIIKNVLQPLIENYFAHGFSTQEGKQNYIRIQVKSIDESYMTVIVEDNGTSIPEASLAQLNLKLHDTIHSEKESYGLKNLHQRIRLFYGDECGLTINNNSEGGVTVRLTLKKIPSEVE